MDTSVCRTGPVSVESEMGLYDRAQLETLTNLLRQALDAAICLSDGFEKNTATAHDIFAVRIAVGCVVGAMMNFQPRRML
jgi:hypothetical protein